MIDSNNVVIPQMQPKKNRFELNTSDRCFALALLVLCVAFISQGLFKGLYFGFSLDFTLIFIAVSIYLARKDGRPGLFATICGILALAGGTVYTFCTNYMINFLLIPTMFILCVIWFSGLAGVKAPEGDLGLLSLLLKNGVADSIVNVPKSAASIASGEEGKKRKVIKVMIGLLFALPVACIVVVLLSEADAAFEKLLSGIVEKIGAYLGYFVCGLILSAFVIAFCYSLKKTPFSKETAKDMSKVDGVYAEAFLGLLSVCYLAYLFSQLAYFFSAFKNLLPKGFSTAEYARRGFFELCVVAVINAIVIFAVIVLIKKKEGDLPVIVKALSIFISLFTLLLCAASISKMVLYIKSYGLTVLRVGTSAFMIVVAVVFIAMIFRMFSVKVKVLHTAVLAASFTVVILGLVNINSLVAGYNYNAYINGKTPSVDVFTIANCGAEGIPYLAKLSSAQNKKIAKIAVYELYKARYDFYEYKFISDWSYINEYPIEKSNRTYNTPAYYNIAVHRAYEAMESFDFSGYDFDTIYNMYILPYYDSFYDEPQDEEYAAEETEEQKTGLSFENFIDLQNDLDRVVDAVRRGISDGSIQVGDEFELDEVNKAVSKIAPDGSLIPMKMTESEKQSVGKIIPFAESIYRIKVYTDSIHFFNGLDRNSDRLVYMFDERNVLTSVSMDDETVNMYSEEEYAYHWQMLHYLSKEKLG